MSDTSQLPVSEEEVMARIATFSNALFAEQRPVASVTALDSVRSRNLSSGVADADPDVNVDADVDVDADADADVAAAGALGGSVAGGGAVLDFVKPVRSRRSRSMKAALIAGLVSVSGLTIALNVANNDVANDQLFVADWVPSGYGKPAVRHLVEPPYSGALRGAMISFSDGSSNGDMVQIKTFPVTQPANEDVAPDANNFDVQPDPGASGVNVSRFEYVDFSGPITKKFESPSLKVASRDTPIDFVRWVYRSSERQRESVRTPETDAANWDTAGNDLGQSWKGSFVNGGWRVQIETFVEPSKIGSMLSALVVSDDGQLTLENPPDSEWVIHIVDSSTYENESRTVEMEHSVVYPFAAGAFKPTTPVVTTLRKPVAQTEVALNFLPTVEKDGHSVWLDAEDPGALKAEQIQSEGRETEAFLRLKTRREAFVGFNGRMAHLTMVGTREELIRMATSLRFAKGAERESLPKVSAFPVGSEIVTGRLLGEERWPTAKGGVSYPVMAHTMKLERLLALWVLLQRPRVGGSRASRCFPSI
jgi:hypothetical protein